MKSPLTPLKSNNTSIFVGKIPNSAGVVFPVHASPDVVVYSSAITTCEKNQQWKMALEIFEQMNEQGENTNLG